MDKEWRQYLEKYGWENIVHAFANKVLGGNIFQVFVAEDHSGIGLVLQDGRTITIVGGRVIVGTGLDKGTMLTLEPGKV